MKEKTVFEQLREIPIAKTPFNKIIETTVLPKSIVKEVQVERTFSERLMI